MVVAVSLTLAASCAPEPSAPPTASPTSATTASPTPSPAPTPTSTATPTAAPTPTPTPTAVDPLAGMTLKDRVAQLFMVGTSLDRADRVTLSAVADQHIGGIFLRGRSHAGTAPTAALVDRFASRSPRHGPPLWVATDQEGGQVQVLSGRGFDDMPSALAQAEHGCDGLQADARRWGRQLTRAGVTMNLAPVADVVASARAARKNPPIGRLDREYGFGAKSVVRCAGAVAGGLRDAGVLPTFKHFPGLGRTAANTDFTADVVDTKVGATSSDVSVYRHLLADGPAVVMVSTAVYERIDPTAPAAFSAPVVTDLLRGDLGFDGVVMTDDISNTAAVADIPPAKRAVRAIRAGVDLLLLSADSATFAPMYRAVLRTARNDPAFAAHVNSSARRIVALKAQQADRLW